MLTIGDFIMLFIITIFGSVLPFIFVCVLIEYFTGGKSPEKIIMISYPIVFVICLVAAIYFYLNS